MVLSLQQLKTGIKHPRMGIRHMYKRTVDRFYRPIALTASPYHPRATNVYEKDWDLLIILDSCRVDALREVADQGQYSFLDADKTESMVSVGGSTLEWTAGTFQKKWLTDIQKTAFISSNGWPYRILWEGYDVTEHYSAPIAKPNWNTVKGNQLGEHIFAWRYGKRGFARQADAETVRDLTIKTGRNTSHDRVIAHFIEPHYPYVSAPERLEVDGSPDEPTFTENPPWVYLLQGGDRDLVWEHYLAELKHGLDYITGLLNNFDAETVLIAADHGEAFGEYGCYGHYGGAIHPHIRRVPIMETSATDEETINPDISEPSETTDVNDHLRALGYL